MKSVLNDVRVVLHRVKEEENLNRDEIGLGKNEIHPLAYHLKLQTDGEIFDDATFKSGYRGVRSPEIRKVLSLFNNGEDKKILEENKEDINRSDVYFYLNKEKDIDIAQEEYEQLDDECQEILSNTLRDLTESPTAFIREVNSEFDEQTGRVVAP